MEGANEEAASRGAANQSKDTEGTAANQQRDGEIAAGNGETEEQALSDEGAEPQAANESTGHRATANEDTGHKSTSEDTGYKSLANDSTGHRATANEDTEHKSTNENTTTPATHKDTANHDTGHKSTNEDTGHKSAANQDTGHKATTNQGTAPAAAAKENSPRQAPTNQNPPSEDPTNDVTPVSANQAQDPWDWSLEEAWLRAPEGEGLEMWGAELEDWEEEPDGQWVELNEQGAEPGAEGAGFNDQGAEPGAEGAGCNDQGAEPADDDWQDDDWWPSPDGSWSKLVVRPGRGLARPGPGSRCRVLLSVPRSGRWGPAPAASGSGRWLTVRPGTAEGRWSCLVDAALETMAAGERARLRPAGAAGATVTVQLGRFTAAPPFWAAPSSRRWLSVTAGHARAAALLGRGLLGPAGRAYSRALRAAILAGGHDPEAGAVKAELHAGLALVQLRLGLPAQAAANAGKALALSPAHLEARYRRGLAQAAMMDLEAATADLVAVLRAQPGHAGARRELRRVRGAARERDARLARRLGRLFA